MVKIIPPYFKGMCTTYVLNVDNNTYHEGAIC